MMETGYYKLILLCKINDKKIEMYRITNQLGLNDPRVISCSQDLDRLLNKYQKLDQIACAIPNISK